MELILSGRQISAQLADAAERFGLHLEPSWSPNQERLPADVHGVVTTYQQVASSPEPVRRIAAQSMVILDEIHHAGDERAWGESVRSAFELSPRRLALSGTPFRSDTNPIPFVHYRGELAVPDFEYGYGDALADGRVVRPVYFPRVNGFMEWIAPDGSVASAAFDDHLDRTGSAQRLRTALSLDGEWLPTVLLQANERLTMIRRQQPDAGGLVIASDQDHAKGIADMLRYRCGVRASVAVSDDPRSSVRIARFATSVDPWIVAVRMISEGVDIPRLRIGVFATTTTTELFFRQAVGRFVRWTRGVPRQKAYLFIPDDPRLRTWAAEIAVARRHSLAKVRGTDEDEPVDETAFDPMKHEEDQASQMSLFAPLSAVATDTDVASVFAEADDSTLDRMDREDLAEAEAEIPELDIALPLLPGGDLRGDGSGPYFSVDAPSARTARQARQELRERNQKLVQELVWASDMTHAQVNARLNRLVGLRRIDEATVKQLEHRAAQAERWLNSL